MKDSSAASHGARICDIAILTMSEQVITRFAGDNICDNLLAPRAGLASCFADCVGVCVLMNQAPTLESNGDLLNQSFA
jgi:hypothetical protein